MEPNPQDISRPSSVASVAQPLDVIEQNHSDIKSLGQMMDAANKRYAAMESQLAGLGQAVQLLLTQNSIQVPITQPAQTPSSAIRSGPTGQPRFTDVPAFDGSPDRFSEFLIDTEVFFKSQEALYPQDAQKIAYIYGRLEPQSIAKAMVANLFLQQKTQDVPALHSYQSFMDFLSLSFANNNEQEEADDALRFLKQGNASIVKHIAKFDAIYTKSSKFGTSDSGLKDFLYSLNKEVKNSVVKDARFRPSILTDLADLKKWLLTDESISRRQDADFPVPVSHVVPMDIGQVLNSRRRWQRMPEEPWARFREAMKLAKVCTLCRDYIGDGHSVESECRLKDSQVSFINTNTQADSYILSCLQRGYGDSHSPPDSSSLRLTVHFSLGPTAVAIVDTGAQIRLFMAKRVADQFPSRSRPRVTVRSFTGQVVEDIENETTPIEFCIQDRKFTAAFVISTTLNADILLGYEWLKANGVLVDCGSDRLIFPTIVSPKDLSASTPRGGSQLLRKTPPKASAIQLIDVPAKQKLNVRIERRLPAKSLGSHRLKAPPTVFPKDSSAVLPRGGSQLLRKTPPKGECYSID
jgi:predicted aspartyl protease